MGQATIKATRRDLRRAVGLSGLQRLQQLEQANAVVNANLSAVIDQAGWAVVQCKDLAVNLAKFKEQTNFELHFEAAERKEIARALLAFTSKGFLARLRWVLTGR